MGNIAICAIAKLENLYLREWVEYYYDMGVKNIILYDNNDIEGEFPQWVIGDYISNGFVIYEDVRGKHRYQLESYNHCYEKYNSSYDWIGFLDIDEYWHLNQPYTIDTLLNEERYPNAVAVFFNWLCYGDCGLLHYDGRKIQERFKTPSFPLDLISNGGLLNGVSKPFVKCDSNLIVTFLDAGYPVYLKRNPDNEDKIFYFVNGQWAEDNLMDYSVAYIKHYRTLTIEEFLYRRFGRKGYADYASFYNKDFIMQLFWDQNEWTQEKQNIVDNFFEKFEVIDDNPIEINRTDIK